MILSLFYVLFFGYLAGKIAGKIGLPPLFGMLLTGLAIGPFGLNLLDGQIQDVSASLRSLALIIILSRAGVNLELEDLKRAGLPAILLCFVPAIFEMVGTLIFAPILLGLSFVDSLLLASVLAAVSPAVIVPHMLKIMEEGYGKARAIPQMILTGASADDVLVIALFGIFSGLAAGEGLNLFTLIDIPLSIILGILAGIALAYGLIFLFRSLKLKEMEKLLWFLCMAFLLYALENILPFAFSGLLGIMVMGILIRLKDRESALGISKACNGLWYFFEILLFVLVGAVLDPSGIFNYGWQSLGLIFLVLLFRMSGVWVSLLAGHFNIKEKVFAMVSYLPKATVQAAIGAIPLAMGLSSGPLILAVAILAVLITAPLGAFLIDLTYKRFLEKSEGV